VPCAAAADAETAHNQILHPGILVFALDYLESQEQIPRCILLVHYNVWSVDSVVAVGYSHRRTLGFKEGFSTEDNEEIEGGSKIYVFRLQP